MHAKCSAGQSIGTARANRSSGNAGRGRSRRDLVASFYRFGLWRFVAELCLTFEFATAASAIALSFCDLYRTAARAPRTVAAAVVLCMATACLRSLAHSCQPLCAVRVPPRAIAWQSSVWAGTSSTERRSVRSVQGIRTSSSKSTKRRRKLPPPRCRYLSLRAHIVRISWRYSYWYRCLQAMRDQLGSQGRRQSLQLVHGIIESVRSDRACTASIRSRGCCRGMAI